MRRGKTRPYDKKGSGNGKDKDAMIGDVETIHDVPEFSLFEDDCRDESFNKRVSGAFEAMVVIKREVPDRPPTPPTPEHGPKTMGEIYQELSDEELSELLRARKC